MATISTALYTHSFMPQSNRATASTTHNVHPQPVEQPEQEVLDDQFATLFCRALYDYDAQDASALSFRRGDIIEVLTQQPSGWWDGLLGEERGWFPSNYVTIISDEEAEAAFAGSDTEGRMDNSTLETSMVDMSQALMGSSQAENEEWLDNELSHRNDNGAFGRPASGNSSQPSDFWMPEVTPDGQIYYVNTHTGQRSRDLPQEAEEEVSDTDLAGLTSQSSSRSGAAAGLPFGPNDTDSSGAGIDGAGFGLPRTNGTPEPWIRKLADDGMSYYYHNRLDGRVQWTRPEGTSRTATSSSRADTLNSASSTRQNGEASRMSAYSDDSDVAPLDHLRPARSKQQLNGHSHRVLAERQKASQVELTSAELAAKSLQQDLSPSPPEAVMELSALTIGAVQAVIENVQTIGATRLHDEDQRMDVLISNIVQTIRNLLYISAPPVSHIPSNLVAKSTRESKTNSSSPLKPSQRKVTATLSRLVLSARAMQYDSGSRLADTLSRIIADAEELEKAVSTFVLEVQRNQHTTPTEGSETVFPKRLNGVFGTANVGPGLVGAGAAGSWKGFGWVLLGDESELPKKVLGPEAISEITSKLSILDHAFSLLDPVLKRQSNEALDQVILLSKDVITQLSSFLTTISDIHVARHVDIDGIAQGGGINDNSRYSQTVDNARHLVRTLEIAMQTIYDESGTFLLTLEDLHDGESSRVERDSTYSRLNSLSTSLKANLACVKQTLEGLLSVGHDQADMAQGDYNGSIEWRMSRLSIINNQFGGAIRSTSKPIDMYDSEYEDVVDIELAFNRSGGKAQLDPPYDSFRTLSNGADSAFDGTTTITSRGSKDSLDQTLVSQSTTSMQDNYELDPETSPLFDDDLIPTAKAPARPAGANKLQRLLGIEYADKVAADLQPWYLRPNYSPADIIIDADGSVRGGTVPALVERLTAHEQADPTFSKAFLMTYKSFTTLDELFDLLVVRFRIQCPDNLTSSEREEWGKLKQHVIQMRVINTFKSMIVDEDVLEKEDMYILDRMKEFVLLEEVARFAAAKQLLILIERAQRAGDSGVKMLVNTNQSAPPPPIMPKTSKKLKLLDIEPLELARQLTIVESQLYQRIKPMECLQRSREQKTENMDNITVVIQTSNRIALWVAECVLSKEDSRKRAQAVKYLISVADRCRTLNNFSSMIAITSGLNTPPIRRLKRTWEQVNQRFMAQFGACEMTIDSNKNFTKYRQLMASVTPPCVPFIGVFLSTLQFIQDGNPDNLPGGLVNFRKRQKASEVINDIKRWQAQSFNLQPILSVQAYIEESLGQFNDMRASSEHFWALSLEREPREREDEKMARLLQESGFL